jgi:hypothetical protein
MVAGIKICEKCGTTYTDKCQGCSGELLRAQLEDRKWNSHTGEEDRGPECGEYTDECSCNDICEGCGEYEEECQCCDGCGTSRHDCTCCSTCFAPDGECYCCPGCGLEDSRPEVLEPGYCAGCGLCFTCGFGRVTVGRGAEGRRVCSYSRCASNRDQP